MAKKTIYELAKELEIAPSTISKALNNVKGVNEKTRKRIIEYAKSTGYVANPTARALKSKRNFTIGILYSEESHIGLEHPFFSPVLQSAKEFLENKGYDLIFINSKSKDYSSYAEFCELRNIAGVFVVSASKDDRLLKELVCDNSFKVVATDYINDDVPTVLSDNYDAVNQLIEYFNKCNFKNVGILCIPNGVRSFKERYNAFLTECSKNNIKVDNENIIIAADYSFSSAYKAMTNYLKNKKELPEAIFALSDIFGVAAIKALTDFNYNVPNNCSVIGFDDIELGRYVTPSLSTLKQNTKEIGEEAATILLSQLNGVELKEKITRVKTTLIIRNSSKGVK